MLNFSASVPIYLHTEPADLRKGIDGLSGIVRGQFAGDPVDGSLYLFVNRRQDRLKILHFDGTGFWLFYKVLEAGTFEVRTSPEKRLTLDATELAMLLGGASIMGVKRRKRYKKAS